MKQKIWSCIRMIPAYAGLALPLLPIGLTRYRWWAAGVLLLLGLFAVLIRKSRPRLYSAIVAFYLLCGIALIIRTREIVDSASTDIGWRIGGAAGALILAFLSLAVWSRRSPKFKARRETGAGEIVVDLLMILLTMLIVRLGQWDLWNNPGLISGLLIAAPLIHFKPRPVVAVIFIACAVTAVYEWHGYMTTKNVERVPQDTPLGIQVEVLRHGAPQALQGARFFAPGQCEYTKGSFYMGEMYHTYRLNPDGSETSLVTPDKHSNNEAVCSVIELCDAGVVITGSDEAKFIRFSDIHTGNKLEDVKLKGQPTFIVLSPDRKYIYVSVINPAFIVRIDLATRRVDREFARFSESDPSFSGICNLIIVGNRVYGAYSSFFTIDDPPGYVFSLDLDLQDYRSLLTFHGCWAVVGPDDDQNILFKVYSRPDLLSVAMDGSGVHKVADLPAGYYYVVKLQRPELVVTNHWSTGEYQALCANDYSRRFDLDFGGMGRPLTVVGNRVMTAVPAGYATLTFAEDLCNIPDENFVH